MSIGSVNANKNGHPKQNNNQQGAKKEEEEEAQKPVTPTPHMDSNGGESAFLNRQDLYTRQSHSNGMNRDTSTTLPNDPPKHAQKKRPISLLPSTPGVLPGRFDEIEQEADESLLSVISSSNLASFLSQPSPTHPTEDVNGGSKHSFHRPSSTVNPLPEVFWQTSPLITGALKAQFSSYKSILGDDGIDKVRNPALGPLRPPLPSSNLRDRLNTVGGKRRSLHHQKHPERNCSLTSSSAANISHSPVGGSKSLFSDSVRGWSRQICQISTLVKILMETRQTQGSNHSKSKATNVTGKKRKSLSSPSSLKRTFSASTLEFCRSPGGNKITSRPRPISSSDVCSKMRQSTVPHPPLELESESLIKVLEDENWLKEISGSPQANHLSPISTHELNTTSPKISDSRHGGMIGTTQVAQHVPIDNNFSKSANVKGKNPVSTIKCEGSVHSALATENLITEYSHKPEPCFSDPDFGEDFGDGFDFDKVFESAISTMRATQISPQNENVVQSHFSCEDFDDSEFDLSSFDDAELSAIDIESTLQMKDFAHVAEGRHITYSRFLVLEVSTRFSAHDHDLAQIHEKILRVFEPSCSKETIVHLREDWYETDVHVGNIIHVHHKLQSTSLHSPNQPLIIDNENGLIILNPDCLVSATYVADSSECLRRSILQDRIRASNDANLSMIYGNLLHTLFQEALLARNFSSTFLQQRIDAIVRSSVRDLFLVDQTLEQAFSHLTEKIPILQEWSSIFLQSNVAPDPRALLEQHNGGNREKMGVQIVRVLDIEEHIWSPAFGIKGNIDATVEVEIHRPAERKPSKTIITPFEIKTGKNLSSASHRAQTILYTLLMSDRYDVPVSSGILYYMSANNSISIPALKHELRSLLIARNQMSTYLMNNTALPSVIKKEFVCKHCYAREKCALVHKMTELGDERSSGLGAAFTTLTSHLTPAHIEFYTSWERTLAKEEEDMQRYRKEIWSMAAEEREKLGRCFAHMRVVKELESTSSAFIYAMEKRGEEDDLSAGAKCNESALLPTSSQLSVGDPIVISSHYGHYALSIGFIIGMGPSHVTVSVDRALLGIPKHRRDFHPESNQTFMKVCGSLVRGCTQSVLGDADGSIVVYRIDKDEPSAGLGLVRNNLLSLFLDESKLRSLIVDLVKPSFEPSASAMSSIPNRLNSGQLRAVEMALSAKNYALILGMPGSGKTFTIACMIKSMVSQGKSVLLTAYMHTAVDNVLFKLAEENVDFIRFGNRQKIDPKLHRYALDEASVESPKELAALLQSKLVFATTCLGINDIALVKRRFDYCIVDEASQVTLPVCVGPLRYANQFILVGDHYQLPPLLRQPAADVEVTVSLFKRLCEAHPQAVVFLNQQYRMNADLCNISNRLIYEGRLRCANEGVANSKLFLPNMDEGLAKLHDHVPWSVNSKTCWLAKAMDPDVRVVFLDTDALEDGKETREVDALVNKCEAALVAQLVEALIECGLDEQDIGIISPYRSQLVVIRRQLQHRRLVDVLTVDKYQGRDKACIIMSFVRSNQTGATGELLKDWRRINVGVTRAKHKLIFVGSASTLRTGSSTICADLMRILNESGSISSIPFDHGEGGMYTGNACGRRVHRFPGFSESERAWP